MDVLRYGIPTCVFCRDDGVNPSMVWKVLIRLHVDRGCLTPPFSSSWKSSLKSLSLLVESCCHDPIGLELSSHQCVVFLGQGHPILYLLSWLSIGASRVCECPLW